MKINKRSLQNMVIDLRKIRKLLGFWLRSFGRLKYMEEKNLLNHVNQIFLEIHQSYDSEILETCKREDKKKTGSRVRRFHDFFGAQLTNIIQR